MVAQIPVAQSAIAESRDDDASYVEVLPDIAFKRLAIVNAAFIGPAHAPDGGWVLIDTGVIGTTHILRRALEQRFGKSRPAAILMTHGHADHAGGLEDLAAAWDVPVFAHRLELPYLNGSAAYPPPDPGVGGGLMSAMSPLFPRGPYDVRDRLHALPEDGSVPFLPGWRWIATPGHTVGHVSFWRESDGTLISGDAFISTNQESAYAVTVQAPELHGPPQYYTVDWQAAKHSVAKLAALNCEHAVTGHGPALQGEALRAALAELALRFDEVAIPHGGKYESQPARADNGTAYVAR